MIAMIPISKIYLGPVYMALDTGDANPSPAVKCSSITARKIGYFLNAGM